MRFPKATVVLTTIFDPVLLHDYYENFKKFGHLDDVEVIVIPDRKTPKEAYTRCEDLAKRGLKCSCPTIEEQEDFLRKVGLPANTIPFNTDNRRNVGFLMAYAAGTDFLVSIDDDNYCQPDEDFLAEHAVVCQDVIMRTVTESATGFLNICDLLEMEKPQPVYPRGFPYAVRHRDEKPHREEQSVHVHVNAGLWLLDADVDAITWLVAKPKAKAFKGESLVLGSRTWSPVNSQNTAIAREAIPSYYYIRMGYPVSGMPIDRYGDIFSGYFVQACAKNLGAHVRVGSPIAEHKRNSHNYLRDATNEWGGILALEDLLPWLTEQKLSGNSYRECFASLSFAIEDAVETFRPPFWTDVTRGYFHQMAYHMRVWLKTFQAIQGV